MEEQRCFRCDISGEAAELFDGIYGNEIVKTCEKCARIEDVPIIKKPSSLQLRSSEKPYTVYERLTRMAGLKAEEKQPELKLAGTNLEKVSLDSLRRQKQISMIKIKSSNLIDNFHWYIARERRRRGLSQKQLAEAIVEPEIIINVIERGELPDDYESVIKKIEHFLRIILTRGGAREQRSYEKIEGKAEKVEAGRIIDWQTIMQEKRKLAEVVKDEKIEEKQEKGEKEKPLEFDRTKIQSLTIADLKKMKEEREMAEKEKREFEGKREDRGAKEKSEKISAEDLIWRAEKLKEEDELVGDEIEIID